MRSAFEEEEDLAPHRRGENREPDRELTISATTLLAIFFGLVLICGLFFGLGYTLGRRSSPESASAQGSNSATEAADSVGGRSKPSPSGQGMASKPASGEAQAETPGSDPTAGDAAASSPASTDRTASDGAGNERAGVESAAPVTQTTPPPLTATRPPVYIPSATVKPGSTAAEPVPAGTGTLMVQIAAISDQTDADVLLSALRKRGYAVSVRRESGDSLMHVQVGPFATRADALAMRQKLLNDGYNAIVK